MENLELLDISTDWLLTTQFVIANAVYLDDLETKLVKLLPFVGLSDVLKLLLVYTPIKLSEPALFQMIDSLEQKSSTKISSQEFNLQLLWEPKNEPKLLKLQLGVSKDMKRKVYQSSMDFVRQTSDKFGWKNYTESKEMISMMENCFIIKLNDVTSNYQLTNELVSYASSSSNTTDDFKSWINNVYYPLTLLTNYSDYTLFDYQVILTVPEQVEMILNWFVKNKFAPEIINNAALPYFKFLGDEAWVSVKEWFATLGNTIVQGKNLERLITQYQTILEFVRLENFLIAVGSLKDDLRDQIVSVLIAIILLEPKTSIEIISYSKEMLTLLKGIDFPETSDYNFSEFNQYKNINEAMTQIRPSISLLDHILKIIESSELLSSSNLSFMQLVNLSNDDHDVQYAKLKIFINAESSYGVTDKVWNIMLSSIYRTFKTTKIFQKVTLNELSTLVLEKLLSLQKFDFIGKTFLKNYNTLNENETEAIILSKSWDYYKAAASCDVSRGGLNSSLKCLLLTNDSTNDFKRLHTLIVANGKLLNWRLYFKSGVPVTPNDILNIGDPMKIISKILDLNSTAYKSVKELYSIFTMLIIGLNCDQLDPLYKYAYAEFEDTANMLAFKIKLVCLQYASTTDILFAYDQANVILDFALEKSNVDGLEEQMKQNWIIFFTLAKFDFVEKIDDYEDSNIGQTLHTRLILLSKLLLFTPTEFNSQVLEYWQMLNSQKEHYLEQQDNNEYKSTNNNESAVNIGDLQSRLHRSLQTPNKTDTTDIGRNIIGWIVGANQ